MLLQELRLYSKKYLFGIRKNERPVLFSGVNSETKTLVQIDTKDLVNKLVDMKELIINKNELVAEE